MRVLDRGGNAVDAGVTAAIALAVLQPDIVSLAGVAPTLVHTAEATEVESFAGLGYWPDATDVGRLRSEGGASVPEGILRTIVPAAMGTHLEVLRKYGTISFEEAATPAFTLAVQGFPMYPFLAANIEKYSEQYDQYEENAKIFRPNGQTPKVGELFKQPDLGHTFRRLISTERAAVGTRSEKIRTVYNYFYKGPLAEEFAAFHKVNNGFLSLSDLESFEVPVEACLHTNYGNYDVYCCNAWCQGISFLQVLNMFEPGEVKLLGHNSVEYIHFIAEALNLTFADREAYLGDPAFIRVPVNGMLSQSYGQAQRQRIDLANAFGAMPPPGKPDDTVQPFINNDGHECHDERDVGAAPDTIYCAVIDCRGNAYSATLSDTSFDTPIVPGTGLALSSRGSQSRLDEKHPNCVESGKRPRLTPTPAMVLRGSKPQIAFGTPGGDVQIQTMLQVFFNLVEFGMPVQQAVEVPRFATWNFPNSFAPHLYYPGLLNLEGRISAEIVNKLKSMNHDTQIWPDYTPASGGVSAVKMNAESNILFAGADPRRAGYAAAW